MTSDLPIVGSYGAYILPAYAVAAIVLGGLSVATILRYRRVRAALKQLEALRSRELP